MWIKSVTTINMSRNISCLSYACAEYWWDYINQAYNSIILVNEAAIFFKKQNRQGKKCFAK